MMMADFNPSLYADSVEVVPSDEVDDIRRAIQTLEKMLKGSREQAQKNKLEVAVIFPSPSLRPC